jgi:hypothetical protein
MTGGESHARLQPMLAATMPADAATSLGVRSWRVSCLILLECRGNPRFGSPDQAAAQRHLDLLKAFVKDACERPNVLECGGGDGLPVVGASQDVSLRGVMYIMVNT